MNAGEFDINIKKCFIADMINNIILDNMEIANKKNLNLSYTIDLNVQHILYTDEGRLCQILSNLISNSIKYSLKGNIHLSVELCSKNMVDVKELDDFMFNIKAPPDIVHCDENNKKYIKFSVCDEGTGIKKDELTNLFRKFSQTSNNNSSNGNSTGLGLIISQRIAQLLHGYITVESEHGKGSEFSLYHPTNLSETTSDFNKTTTDINIGNNSNNIGDDNENTNENENENENINTNMILENNTASMSVPPLSNITKLENITESIEINSQVDTNKILSGKIMIVEDNEQNKNLFVMLINNFNKIYNYEIDITPVSNGFDAIELSKIYSYDIIFMDINMYGIDGCDASALIRKNGFIKPIIATTGNIFAKKENQNNVSKSMYEPFTKILIKPFTDKQLLEILMKYLKMTNVSNNKNYLIINENENENNSEKISIAYDN
jgi:two-component system chemotaxis sensor kinase CheA